jgi:hypothetical protein
MYKLPRINSLILHILTLLTEMLTRAVLFYEIQLEDLQFQLQTRCYFKIFTGFFGLPPFAVIIISTCEKSIIVSSRVNLVENVRMVIKMKSNLVPRSEGAKTPG